MGLNDLREKYDYPVSEPEVKELKHGWVRAEHIFFFRTSLTPKTKVVVELGSWLGSSARLLCDRAPNATIICVDNWKGTLRYKHLVASGEPQIPLYNTFLVNTWDLKDRIIPVKEDSVIGLKKIKEAGIIPDIIYVDAGHLYDEVMADITTSKSLFPEVFVCGDDYNFNDVHNAVHNYAKEHNLEVCNVDSVWWYK